LKRFIFRKSSVYPALAEPSARSFRATLPVV
jgi:hypothetical protein